MDPANFDKMSRDDLVAKARSLGVERPELMTRVELGDEIVRRTQSDPTAQQRARGWLGVARDLVASVVSTGLSMPDAAALIRGERGVLEFKGPSPVATVTLAEIYATQGHTERALNMLDEVLAREPEHAAAQALRERLRAEPRARRGEVVAARPLDSEREPLASEAAPVAVGEDVEAAPATSQSPLPLDVEAEPAPIAEARAVAEAVAEVVERADDQLLASDVSSTADSPSSAEAASEFAPVSLAPPLTDPPTRPDASALDAAIAAPVVRAPEPVESVAPPPSIQPEPVELVEAVAPPPNVEPEPALVEAVAPPPSIEPEPVEPVAPPPNVEAAPEQVDDVAPPPLLLEPQREPVPPAALDAEPAQPVELAPPRESAEPSAPDAAFEPEVSAPDAASEPEASAPASDVVPTLMPAAPAESEPVLLVLHRADAEPLVCWDVPEREGNDVPLELECHAFSVSSRGAERRSLTLPVAARRGSAKLPGFGAATLIRAALGTRAESGFVPLVIASELSEQAGNIDVRFRPPFSQASALTETEQSLVQQFVS